MKRAAKLAVEVTPSKFVKKSTNSKVTMTPATKEFEPLLSLGQLYQGTVLRRPSEHNKSPYVADVKLDHGGAEVIAHAPMLDLGGLLKPGTVVRMTKSKPGGKTSHAVQLVRVEEVECGEDGHEWVGAHPSLGNSVARALLDRGFVSEAALGYSATEETPLSIASEVTMAETAEGETVRADFVVDNVVVEVKSCVCADYQKASAPQVTKKDRYVTVISEDEPEDYKRAGLFPIGKRGQDFEGQKVVSARCLKHLRHLAKVAGGQVEHKLDKKLTEQDEHERKTFKAAVLLLVVNRGDCLTFRPCSEACPVFAHEFKAAQEAGVKVVAAGVRWEGGGSCFFRGLLPINTP